MSKNCGVVYVKPGGVEVRTLPIQNLKIPMVAKSIMR